MDTRNRFACMNGAIVPLEDATVHVLSGAVKYATSIFEGLRGYWSETRQDLYMFRLDDHLQRLFDGLKIMRLETDTDLATVRDWVLETVRANQHRGAMHMRVLAHLEGRGAQGTLGPVGFAITTSSTERPASFETGVKLGISSWVKITERMMPPSVKSVANYNNGRLAMVQAKMDGYDNALMLTEQGHIAETTGSSFCMIKQGRLITPMLSDDILASITRDTVLRVARAAGLAVEERHVGRSEAMLADEAFVCGSNQEILPVASIDKTPVGDGTRGAITADLQQRYLDVVENRADNPAGWCTPVYQGAA
jgi:branched-chain amino acid aminotransferase